MLNFGSIFQFIIVKSRWGPVAGKGGLASLGHSQPHVNFEGLHPLGLKIYSSEIFDFGWVNMYAYSFLLLDQISPNFLSPNAGGVVVAFRILDISIFSGDIRDRSLKLSEFALR